LRIRPLSRRTEWPSNGRSIGTGGLLEGDHRPVGRVAEVLRADDDGDGCLPLRGALRNRRRERRLARRRRRQLARGDRGHAGMGTIAENAPLPSAAPLTVAFVVVFLMLIVLRPWVWPTIVALLAFTTPLFFGEVIVIRGLLVSRM